MPEAQVAVSWTNEEKKWVSLPLHLRFREYCLTWVFIAEQWPVRLNYKIWPAILPAIVGWQPISVQNNRKELAVLDL